MRTKHSEGQIVTRRRNNAPIRPRRPATGIPDLLFAFAAAAIVMAIVFAVASFSSDALASGDAGRILARVFAATLAFSGVLLFALGFGLLRDERGQGDHYRVPLAVGAAAGLAESAFFLRPAGLWLLAPMVLFVLALRPVRRALSRRFAGGRR